ncbi:MAG: PAS and ANTAR domain-containing protein [Nocardioidaceae bacterium]
MSAPAFDGSQVGPPVGYFTYLVAEDRWEWSDGMYALHGFGPQEVPATTAVLMSHKHPDDRVRTYEVFEQCVATGEPFSCYHRVVDRHERVRSVLSVGRGVRAGDGAVSYVQGFFADLTQLRRDEAQVDVDSALQRIAETRAVIEQAKGMLMMAAGCDADTAFELLRKGSADGNVKLRHLATRLVEAASAGRLASAPALAALRDSLSRA